jgi:hypothetical protein
LALLGQGHDRFSTSPWVLSQSEYVTSEAAIQSILGAAGRPGVRVWLTGLSPFVGTGHPARKSDGAAKARRQAYAAAFLLYGPCFAGAGRDASIISAKSSMDHSRSDTPTAMAGDMRSVLCRRTKSSKVKWSDRAFMSGRHRGEPPQACR